MDATEKRIRPANGYAALFILIALSVVSIACVIISAVMLEWGMLSTAVFATVCTLGTVLFIIFVFCFAGLRVVNPNEALVLSLFGKYTGTIYDAGFYYVNPFSTSIYPKKDDEETAQALFKASGAKAGGRYSTGGKKVSTKISTFVNGNQKVNDALGNPVEVSAIVIWKIVNATKAVINVDNYMEYLSNQTDSTIRNIARLYPYDIVSDEGCGDDETTLRGSATTVALQMKDELQGRVVDAGIEVIDVRLNQIAYAPEIAAAMLQRQQATAVIAARKKIVEGAVSMVEMALERLRSEGVVDLDEERKAQMVGNMMVVLCSNREASPIVNAGSIY